MSYQTPQTTKDKATEILGTEKLRELANAGLMIIDRQDFEVVIAQYNRAENEIKMLNLRLKQAEKAHREEMQRLKDQQTLGVLG